MADDTPNEVLREILGDTKTIATVGVSTNPVRASYFVARYLHYRGYKVIPINPVYAGVEMFGSPVLASLADIPSDIRVDMVDVFRKPDAIPAILEETLEHLPHVRTFWMQFGIYHQEVAEKARAAGMRVVQDRCPKVEFQRLFGELRKVGINTGIVSSKLPEWM